MRWTVVFFDGRVEATLLKLQPSFVARFIRYAERSVRGDRRIVILHHFAKKSSKPPVKELAIARKRLEETAG